MWHVQIVRFFSVVAINVVTLSVVCFTRFKHFKCNGLQRYTHKNTYTIQQTHQVILCETKYVVDPREPNLGCFLNFGSTNAWCLLPMRRYLRIHRNNHKVDICVYTNYSVRVCVCIGLHQQRNKVFWVNEMCQTRFATSILFEWFGQINLFSAEFLITLFCHLAHVFGVCGSDSRNASLCEFARFHIDNQWKLSRLRPFGPPERLRASFHIVVVFFLLPILCDNPLIRSAFFSLTLWNVFHCRFDNLFLYTFGRLSCHIVDRPSERGSGKHVTFFFTVIVLTECTFVNSCNKHLHICLTTICPSSLER